MTDSPAPSTDVTGAPATGTPGTAPTVGDRVFRVYAVKGALSVPGVVDHASGINRITGRRLPRAEVRWDADHRSVTVDLQIAVAWPAPVVDVARTVRSCTAQWITATTGVPVSVVNVEVGAVVPVPGRRVTAADLTAADHGPELTPVVATPLPVSSPTVDRGVPEPGHPTVPAHTGTVPVRAHRPPAPARVPVPAPPELTPVTTLRPPPHPSVTLPPHRAPDPVRVPPRGPLTPVHAPVTVTAFVPSVPGPPPLRMVDVTRRPLDPVAVDHRPPRSPETPGGPAVLREIPTPPGPRLENIPTPAGLPVTAVPTPRGLPLTVFPRVARRGITPVTVHHRPLTPVTVDRRHRDTDRSTDRDTDKGRSAR